MPTTLTTPTTSTTDIDPATGLPKIKPVVTPTLPQQDPNKQNSTVKLSDAAMSGAAAPAPAIAPTDEGVAQGNTQVLAKAQTDVLGQPQTSALQDAMTQQALNWVNDPTQGYDPAKYKQGRMEKAQNDWANTYEGLRQQYGNVSGSGLLQQNMLQNALNHNVDMNNLESTTDQENYNRQIDALGKSSANAQSVNQGNENVFTQRLGNLNTVRGMAEGQETRTAAQQQQQSDQDFRMKYLGADQAGSQALAELQGKIATGAQMTALDFQASQNALDRAQKEALQKGDIAGQQAILAQKAVIDKQAQEADQAFKMKYLSADQAGQQDLTKLTEELRKGTLLSQQDFQASQSALDRALETAKQTNDIAAQKDILNQKASLDAQAQKAQNDFADSQRVANQLYDTTKTKTQQDFDKAAQYYDYQMKQAMQSNDITAQTALATMKAANDLAMQTNGMTHDETMAKLTADLNEAKANNDVGRQKDILTYSANLDAAKLEKEFGHEEAMKSLDNAYAVALQNNDFTHAEALQTARITADMQQQDKTLERQDRQIALQERGMTNEEAKQKLDALDAAVAAGVADPSTVGDWLKSQGIDYKEPDPLATQKAAIAKNDAMVATWGLTHPDNVTTDASGKMVLKTVDANGKPDTTSAQAYNDFVNGAMGEKTFDIATVKADPSLATGGASATGTPDAQAAYNTLKANAVPWIPTTSLANTKNGGKNLVISSVPANGTPIIVNGKVYISSGSKGGEHTLTGSVGSSYEYLIATDPNTGTPVKITAMEFSDAYGPYKKDNKSIV